MSVATAREPDMKSSDSLTIVIKLGAGISPYTRSTRKQPLTNFAGTSSIVDEKTHEPILSILTLIVETAAKLRRDGHRVVLVSSGAVGVGLRRMDVDERPKYIPRIQVRGDWKSRMRYSMLTV